MSFDLSLDLTPILDAIRDIGQRLDSLERQVGAIASRLPSRMVSPIEAAKQLGVSVPTIRRRIKDGSLHAVRVGRAWRVDTTSLGAKSDDEIAALAFRARNENPQDRKAPGSGFERGRD